jgi:hypothetical protein
MASLLFLQVSTKEVEALPPWIRSERERQLATEEGSDLPFPVYLIGSALVAIAAVSASDPLSYHLRVQHSDTDIQVDYYLADNSRLRALQVGSIFEYFNRHAIFGVVSPDNLLWAPILGFFAITGFPSAGALRSYVWPVIIQRAFLLCLSRVALRGLHRQQGSVPAWP